MSTTVIVVIAVVVLLLLAAVVALLLARRKRARQRAELQDQFGPEYDREVTGSGRRHAERGLAERRERHSSMDLHQVDPQAQQRFADRWRRAQSDFVNDPQGAVAAADQLTTEIMRARGYPTESFEQQVEDLSVEHASALDHYRAGHDVAEAGRGGRATTEELRQGMLHYRTLVGELLGASAAGGAPTGEAVPGGRPAARDEDDRPGRDQQRPGEAGPVDARDRR